MKECLNCLNSTPGHCGLHAPKIEMVGYTCTTSTSRKYSKSEVEKEVIYFANYFCVLKWYQNKKYAKRELKYWVDFLKQWD